MPGIVAGILSLTHYVASFEDMLKACRLKPCTHCGQSVLWLHGCYARKADRLSRAGESLNPLRIQRFLCPHCQRTCSVLPECIPAHRWYVWQVQQVALLLVLSGKSCCAVAKQAMPSRHTLKRWLARFKEQFHFHKEALCHHNALWGREATWTGFWQTVLKQMPLSSAMRLCHVAGVAVP